METVDGRRLSVDQKMAMVEKGQELAGNDTAERPDPQASAGGGALAPIGARPCAVQDAEFDGQMKDDDVAEVIASHAQSRGLTVAVVESLSAGAVASILGAAPNASDWFAGGIVAYATRVKHDLLHVTPGPVVSGRCAEQMAHGGMRLLQADVVVSTTGAGGPEPQDGQPVGTVFIAVATPNSTRAAEYSFEGAPEAVVAQTVSAALSALRDAVERPHR